MFQEPLHQQENKFVQLLLVSIQWLLPAAPFPDRSLQSYPKKHAFYKLCTMFQLKRPERQTLFCRRLACSFLTPWLWEFLYPTTSARYSQPSGGFLFNVVTLKPVQSSHWWSSPVRYGFIKIRMKVVIFIKNHFHQKPLSSKTTFIKTTFIRTTLIKIHFHQNPFSSKTIFIKNHFHQKPLSSRTIFIKNHFHQKPLSSKTTFIKKPQTPKT